MLRKLGKRRLGMGVGAGEMLIVDGVSAQGAHVSSMLPLRDYLPGASSPETAIWEPAVSTALAQAGKISGNLQISVSDDWVRYWMVTPPAGLGSLAELRALAANRFEQLFGAPAESWHIEADWGDDRAMLACALPKSLIAALGEVSRQHDCTLGSIVPEAVRLINRDAGSLGDDGWVCSFGTHSFLALLRVGGRLLSARQFRFDLLPTLPEVLARLETEALRMGLDMPQSIFLLGDAPPMVELPDRSQLRIVPIGRQLALPTPIGLDRKTDAYRLALYGAMN
ncbi:hypothetical protein VVD49_14365 [Uliginosibacterium sp. H3]|uniref:Pilus assembly protein PilM n=1 Tax=Uliginosibacterium silvisoli TaxID=3114758 RepID=A0ABU6K6P3_9RHOO|nr:hypothetical protein [Uliginosibacterium sp. H3]